MKILFLNTSDNGGAFIAAKRIASLQKKQEVHIDIITTKSTSGLKYFRINLLRLYLIKVISYLQQYFYRKAYISFGNLGIISAKKLNQSSYDVIHLHWINSGFISLNQIRKITKPIVWTIHDQWIVNGIRHTKLDDEDYWLLERINRKRIKKIISQDNLKVVTPSDWLGQQIRESYGTKVQVIPNPFTVNKQLFELTIKQTTNSIAFLHTNINDFHKGFDLLLSALNLLSEDEKPVLFISSQDYISYNKIVRVPFFQDEIQFGKFIKEMSIIAVPSRIDNYPNLCVESIALGTPILAFSIGGIPEIVNHKKTGYLAKPFDIDDLKNGILYLLRTQLKTTQINNFETNSILQKKYYSLYK